MYNDKDSQSDDYQQPPKPPSPQIHPLIAVILLGIVVGCVCGGVMMMAGSHNTSTQDTNAAATQVVQSTEAQVTQEAQATQDAQSTQDAQPTAQPTFPPQQWKFTGNGNQKTTGFAPLRDTWQLSWTCDPASYGTEYNLIVLLYDINSTLIDEPVNVICKDGVTSGSTMEYNASGIYDLDVNSEGPWTIKVQTQ